MPSHKGASTHILAFCRALGQAHDVTLLTLGEVALPSAPGFRHLAVTPGPRNPLERGLAFRALVARALERERPAVFHFRTPWEGMAALDVSYPGRVLYEVNGLPSVEWPSHHPSMTGRSRAILRGWEQRCLERADLVVCPSELVRAHLLERVALPPGAGPLAIPNGTFPPVALPPREATVGRSALRLVYIGTLSPWQGLGWALRALRPLAPGFTLDVYAPAGGRHTPRIERLVHRLGLGDAVRILPALDQATLGPTLARYDLGLCPLLATERNVRQGCYPLKLIDYVRAGLPTLAPDLPCVRQVLPDERTCIYYIAGSLGSFRDVVAALTGPLPRTRVEDTALITWEEAGRRLRSAYAELLSRPG